MTGTRVGTETHPTTRKVIQSTRYREKLQRGELAVSGLEWVPRVMA